MEQFPETLKDIRGSRCLTKLHALHRQTDRLSDEDQQALVILLDSLIKRPPDGPAPRLLTRKKLDPRRDRASSG